MNVILLEKIGRLGNLGSQVAVKAGFARNFLFPQSKAVPATADNVTKFEARRAELEKAAQEVLKAAQARAEALRDCVVSVAGRASEEGKLYGSVGTKDLADAIGRAGVVVNKSEILLPNGPLHVVGEHEVQVHLHADVTVTVKVNVVTEA
jgi:large subunit ribosomal protein L9